MNLNELRYKGFRTQVHYEEDSNTYYGKIENIDDLVTFECEEDDEYAIMKAFRESVDDYIEFLDTLNQK